LLVRGNSIQKDRKTQEEERIRCGWCGACKQEFLRSGLGKEIKNVKMGSWQDDSGQFLQLLARAAELFRAFPGVVRG